MALHYKGFNTEVICKIVIPYVKALINSKSLAHIGCIVFHADVP